MNIEEKYKEIVKDKFKIKDFDSEEGKKQRNTILQSISVVFKELVKLIGSTLSNKEKAKKIQNYLKGVGILTTIGGIYQAISGLNITLPSFSKLFKGELNLDDVTHMVEFGPSFWLKVALFLLVLKIVHKIISSGTIFVKDIGNTWKGIKKFYKKVIWKDMNENEKFLSRQEYEYLKLLME